MAQSLTHPVAQSVDPEQQSVTRPRTGRRRSATDRRRYGDAKRRLVTYVTEQVDARIQSIAQDAGTSVARVVALVMGAGLPRVEARMRKRRERLAPAAVLQSVAQSAGQVPAADEPGSQKTPAPRASSPFEVQLKPRL